MKVRMRCHGCTEILEVENPPGTYTCTNHGNLMQMWHAIELEDGTWGDPEQEYKWGEFTKPALQPHSIQARVAKVFDGTLMQNDASLSTEQVRAITVLLSDMDFAKAVYVELTKRLTQWSMMT